MAKLTIGKKNYNSRNDETVLDALLRQDVNVPYGCKQGSCQSCMMQSQSVLECPEAQEGLKDTLKAQNYFLSCCCVPKQDMTIKQPDQSDFYTQGRVVVNEMLNRNTILLIIECQDAPEYFAGQFVNLQRDDGLTRSYSIANTPQDSKTLEFHIRRLPGGQFSEWLHDYLKVEDTIAVSEAKGHCFYLPDRKEQGILLVGTGTGLAPLVGILTDALLQGHSGPIQLFHGSSELEDLYRIDEMRQLSIENSNFFYTPCISGKNVPENFESGRVNQVALNTMTDLSGWRVFLCGHPEMVNQMKTACFLNGANVSDIYTDAFVVQQTEEVGGD